jgi:REP element-mobilizing transposase RayT
MARPLRLQVAGGIYHVTARGNAGGCIYLDDADRHRFLRVVARVSSRFDWQCFAYCLMGNHYHLVVQTPRPNLVRGMQQLNGTYAQRFNQRHGRRRTHVFQGRYHAVLVQRDPHLLELARYIAWNPVRAGLCAQPEAWRWSSHRALLGLASTDVVAVEAFLSYFGDTVASARRTYRAFVERAEPEEPSRTNGAIVGNDAFLRSLLPPAPPSPEVSRVPWNAVRPSLSEVFATHARDAGIARAYRDLGYSMREIAEALGCHYCTVSRRLRAWEARSMLQCKT